MGELASFINQINENVSSLLNKLDEENEMQDSPALLSDSLDSNYQQEMITSYAGSSSISNPTTSQNSSSSNQDSPVNDEENDSSNETTTEETPRNEKGILVKKDPQITLPEIYVVLNTPGPNEAGEGTGEDTELQQTKATGILTPLLKIGNTTIPADSIGHLHLYGKRYPRIEVDITDTFNLVDTFDKPNANNNKMQLQILPQFENIYKKINLMFWIEDYSKDGEALHLEGTYIVPGLYDIKMKAYGEITTYEFFEQVSSDLQLGFASNIENTEDKRWIYIPNKRYLDSMNSEISFGGNESQVLDWWIDWWNYLTLVDMTERTKTIDKDITIWVNSTSQAEVESIYTSEPVEMEAFITNNTSFSSMQNYVETYDEEFSPVLAVDKIIEYYNMKTLEQDTFKMMDEDSKNDIKTNYEYFGECFREFNYLKSKAINDAWKKKIRSSAITVTLNQPCLGLMRGCKVNFYWYNSSEFTKDTPEDELETNIPIDPNLYSETTSEEEDKEDKRVIDKQVSGQYYIDDCEIEYDFNNGNYDWKHYLTLIRPEDQKDYFDWESIKIDDEQ